MKKLEELSRELGKKYKNIDELVLSIRKEVISHADSLSDRYEPKNIIESRFTPAQEAYEKGIVSCGAMSNIPREILGYLGYKVKLIHGECKESVDHAWISVFNPQSGKWEEFDLTRKDVKVLPTHIKKAEIESWEDLRAQIESDHKTMVDRRKQRGLI